MDNLDAAAEKAEFYLELASQCPPKLKAQPSSSKNKWKSIHQKLTELYMEECSKEPKQKNLRTTSNLLEKLIAREKLNFLIINLYPRNDGYSLMLKSRTGVDTETMRLSYEESELLQCINNEELPPILVDLLDRSQVHIFYSGCVIAEIRDYRRSNSCTIYDCHHVLLKPTLQTLLCDLNTITNDNSKWAPEDKQLLESQLILATQEPLCLNPSHTVALVANKLQYNLNKFGTLNKVAKKWSQVTINRKRKFEIGPAPPCLRLHDFLKKRNQGKESKASNRLKKFNDTWREYPTELTCPDTIEVEKRAKPIARPKTPDFDIPVLVEEHLFESEPHAGKISHTHLTVKRYPIEEVYVCELYIDKDYVQGEDKGSTYNFTFKSRDLVDKYINQFTEIVTEEGRKSVKITHLIPGQPPKVTNSQSGTNEVLGTMPPTTHSVTAPSCPAPAAKPSSRILAPLSISSVTNTSNANANTNVSAASQVPSANRGLSRQVSLLGSNSRPASASPGPPSVTSPGLLPSYSQAVSQASAAKSVPTPPPLTRTPTPRSTPTPPAPTPPPRNTTPGPRRPPSTDNYVPAATTPTPVSTTVGPLGLISSVPLGLAGILTAGNTDPNATLTPPMSIAGVPMSSGIAVPISLAMMHATQQSNIMSSATTPGMIVNPVPGLMGTPALANAGAAHSAMTMTTTVSTMSGPAVIVTSGMLTSSSPGLATHTNMLPLPLGISGTLNQLMTSGLKNTPGLRPAPAGQPLSLLQVASSGQPTLSLFGQIHRPLHAAQGKATGQLAASLQRSITPSPPSQGPTPPPNVAVTSPVMTTLLPQQQAILYQKQAGPGQVWPQQQAQVAKPKSRKRSASASAKEGPKGRDGKK